MMQNVSFAEVVYRLSLFFVCCIALAAYASLIERKLIGRIQKRFGPDHCGIFGVLQPIADAFKLLFKRKPFLGHSIQSIFAVLLLFTISLSQLTLIPISPDNIFTPQNQLLLIIVTHGIITFCEVLIGTTSRSKYGIIGGNRAYTQLLGGHLAFLLSIIVIMTISKSTNLCGLVHLENGILGVLKIVPIATIFFITLLINWNRTPFDFAEAESELVAGAYVEYGGILFALIYLSDYLNLLFISSLFSILFLGGYSSSILPGCPLLTLMFKTLVVMGLIILIRAILPRYTQQRMIYLSWRFFLPILLVVYLII